MDNRHRLENALYLAILAAGAEAGGRTIETYRHVPPHDLETIKILIRAIQVLVGPDRSRLMTRDKVQTSFLMLALEKGAHGAATILLEVEKADNTIIFEKQPVTNRTLFWFAANKGYIDIFQQLLEISAKQPAQNSQSKLWLQADHKGNTPLHAAALNGHSEIVMLLLKQIANENHPRKIINLVNKQGHTALHEALYNKDANSCSPTMIANLIQSGAYLNISNEHDVTPMLLLCNLAIEDQIDIFAKLDRDHQLSIFKFYRETLIKKQEVANATIHRPVLHAATTVRVKKLYFQLASTFSLQELLIAHHEFNPLIPKRNIQKRVFTYHKFNPQINLENPKEEIKELENEIKEIENKTYFVAQANAVEENQENVPAEYIVDDVLKRMPVYAKRVLPEDQAEQLIEGQQKENAIICDKAIRDVDTLLNNLASRPAIFSKILPGRSLAVAAANIISLAFTSWLSYEAITKESIPNSENDPKSDFTGYAIASGIALNGGCLTLSIVIACAGALQQNIKTEISQDEWQELSSKLQMLLKTLQNLQTAPSTNLQDLEVYVSALKAEKIELRLLMDLLLNVKKALEKLSTDFIESQILQNTQEKTKGDTVQKMRSELFSSNKSLTFQPKAPNTLVIEGKEGKEEIDDDAYELKTIKVK